MTASLQRRLDRLDRGTSMQRWLERLSDDDLSASIDLCRRLVAEQMPDPAAFLAMTEAEQDAAIKALRASQ